MLRQLVGHSLTSRLWFAATTWALRALVAGAISTGLIAAFLFVVGWTPDWIGLKILLAFFVGVFLGASIGTFLRDVDVPPEAIQ